MSRLICFVFHNFRVILLLDKNMISLEKLDMSSKLGIGINYEFLNNTKMDFIGHKETNLYL